MLKYIQQYYRGGTRNVTAIVPGETVQTVAKQNSDGATLSRCDPHAQWYNYRRKTVGHKAAQIMKLWLLAAHL